MEYRKNVVTYRWTIYALDGLGLSHSIGVDSAATIEEAELQVKDYCENNGLTILYGERLYRDDGIMKEGEKNA